MYNTILKYFSQLTICGKGEKGGKEF